MQNMYYYCEMNHEIFSFFSSFETGFLSLGWLELTIDWPLSDSVPLLLKTTVCITVPRSLVLTVNKVTKLMNGTLCDYSVFYRLTLLLLLYTHMQRL